MNILYFIPSEKEFAEYFGERTHENSSINNIELENEDFKFDKIVVLLLGRDVDVNDGQRSEFKSELRNYYAQIPDDVKNLKTVFEDNFKIEGTIIQCEEFNGILSKENVESFFDRIYNEDPIDADRYYVATTTTVTKYFTLMLNSLVKYNIKMHPSLEDVAEEGYEKDPDFYQKISNYSTQANEKIYGIQIGKSFENIITSDDKLIQVKYIASIVAKKDLPVWILGDSGTGKELFAKAIHKSSERASKPFIAINCAAISKEILDSELFGHVKGAFTGATSKKIGIFEAAEGGTIFLDEVADMSFDTQAKLLRALESDYIRKVGAAQETKILKKPRIISASNKNLYNEVKNQKFREDLFYRLNKFELRLPPLRDRSKMDIVLLYAKKCHENNYPVKNISESASKLLSEYDFPGNIRQLNSIIDRAIIFSEVFKKAIDDEIIKLSIGELSYQEFENRKFGTIQPESDNQISYNNIMEQKFGDAIFYEGFTMKAFLKEVDKHYIVESLRHHKTQKEAGKALGYTQQVISNKILKYNIDNRQVS